MSLLLSVRDNSLPSPVVMHLSLLLFVVGKLKISRCRELNFLSTITVLSLPPPKFPLSPRKSCDKLVSESADVEDGDSGGVPEGLLLLWMIASQSICLVPWLLLSLFLGFPSNYSVLWGVFPWEGSKSFPQNLLSPREILKLMLALGRTFWYWSENLSVNISVSLAINKSSNEDAISSMSSR